MQYCFVEDRTYNNSSDGYHQQMAVGLHPSDVCVVHRKTPELYKNNYVREMQKNMLTSVMQMLEGDESPMLERIIMRNFIQKDC